MCSRFGWLKPFLRKPVKYERVNRVATPVGLISRGNLWPPGRLKRPMILRDACRANQHRDQRDSEGYVERKS